MRAWRTYPPILTRGASLMWWQTLLGVLAGVLLVYLVLLGLLWRYSRFHPEAVSMRAALRLLPDLLRLVRRLAGAGLRRRCPRRRVGAAFGRQACRTWRTGPTLQRAYN